MAWVAVQGLTQGAQGGDPRTLAYGVNVTAGNLLVFGLQWGNGGGTATFSKSAGTATVGAFTTVRNVNNAADAQSLALGWCLCTGTGSLTIQGTDSIPSGSFCELGIMEFSGNAVAGGTDGSNGQTTASTTPNSGNFSPVTSGDLIVGVAVDTAGGGTVTAGAGMTVLVNAPGANLLALAYKVLAGSGSTNAAFANTAAENTIVIGAAFLPPTAGVPPGGGLFQFGVGG